MTESNIRRTVLANGVASPPSGCRTPLGRRRHLADARLAPRARRESRHRALRRAHAVQGTRHEAEEIAQQVDSIGGQIDAFTSKEYAGYYLKVLDEHLPLAVDILADLICNPLFAEDDIEREKKVILEEIKMVEDTPDDLVHEIFAENFWSNHPLGRPILGTPLSVNGLDRATLQDYFTEDLRGVEFRRRRGRQS